MLKEETKFIGANVKPELKELIEEDARAEKRSASKHIEFCVLLALLMRGHDISHLTDLIQYNSNFQEAIEFLEWKEKSKKKK